MSHDTQPSSGEIRVCHIVNSLSEKTGPANHALALQQHTSVDAGLLAWFSATALDEWSELRTHCVNAPDTLAGVDMATIRAAISVLSEYDVVHTHHPHSATFGKLIARYLVLPVVYTYGTPSFRYTRKGRLASGLTNVFASRITCVSPGVRDTLQRWERLMATDEQTEIVYTGVNTEETQAAQQLPWSVRDVDSLPDGGLLVGHAGRLIDAKAQDVLIKGVAAANRQLDDQVFLLIAGDGEKKPQLVQLAANEGIADNVIFLGLLPRERAYKLMGDVDVFAMPSKWEGFSSAAAEAMSVGTACLFSDIQTFREPFEGAAAFHSVGDPAGLADELVLLLSDPTARETLGTQGRQRIDDRFTIRNTAEAYARLYHDII
jgi:glycosyltransferase involved in cell wall biosynthesis